MGILLVMEIHLDTGIHLGTRIHLSMRVLLDTMESTVLSAILEPVIPITMILSDMEHITLMILLIIFHRIIVCLPNIYCTVLTQHLIVTR